VEAKMNCKVDQLKDMVDWLEFTRSDLNQANTKISKLLAEIAKKDEDIIRLEVLLEEAAKDLSTILAEPYLYSRAIGGLLARIDNVIKKIRGGEK
jgi:chromosome segregation ATPase